LFNINYPDKNKDVLNMIAGVLNSSCLVMVLSFFFGSSKGSQDKDNTIKSLTEG